MAEEEAKRGELAAKEAALDQALADWNHLMSMDPRSEPLFYVCAAIFMRETISMPKLWPTTGRRLNFNQRIKTP